MLSSAGKLARLTGSTADIILAIRGQALVGVDQLAVIDEHDPIVVLGQVAHTLPVFEIKIFDLGMHHLGIAAERR